jgi:predicted dehydrogenase
MTVAGRTLGVAIVGCGRIGRRRAEVAAADERTAVRAVVDTDATASAALASETGAAAAAEWEAAVAAPDVDVVVVATPNAYLVPVAEAALAAGRHVLLEKPMGRSLEEAERLAAAAAGSDRVLKIGFNHRYHPGLAELLRVVASGQLGPLVHVLARYGHGGRPGLEREWRGDPELAGGGHLLDQGVHVADLIHAVAGLPAEAVAFLRTAVWPIAPLEDNAYAMYRYADGLVAQLQVSMTQWKNRFSFEVVGELGAVAVEGLGGSYGDERLVLTRRRLQGGAPEMAERAYPGPDGSWVVEWDDFVGAVVDGRSLRHGSPAEGLAAMRMIDALYRSHREGGIVAVA